MYMGGDVRVYVYMYVYVSFSEHGGWRKCMLYARNFETHSFSSSTFPSHSQPSLDS